MYTLVNGEERAKNNPTTFQIPSDYQKSKVTISDFVKIGFEEEGGFGERMWVSVTKRTENSFEGTLISVPLNLESIKHGDIVKFNSKHIIGVS